jgi:acyl carrier protein
MEGKTMNKEIEAKVLETLRKHVGTEINPENIGLDDNLAEAGLNSLKFIRIVVDLEEEFGFEFAEEDLVNFEKFNTLRNIAAYIEDKAGT